MYELTTLRVAARYASQRLAGVLEAPPAMHAAIMEWIAAVLAANKIQDAQKQLDRARTSFPQEAVNKLKAAAKAFQADLTWKNYTPLHESLWLFGHPGTRWSIKDFQKLTPEKREALDKRASELLKHIEERLKEIGEGYEASVAKATAALREAEKYRQPGVDPLTDFSIKQFPVDLQGWRYDSAVLRGQIKNTIEKGKVEYRELYESMVSHGVSDKEWLDRMREMAESGRGYDHITVELTLQTSDYSAHWAPAQRRMAITVPRGSSPGIVVLLNKTLRHELQHFAQSYLAFALGREWNVRTPGTPARGIQTPEYKQHYDPKSPQHDPKSPEVVKIYQSLKSKGVDVSKVDWHALDDIEFYTRLADTIEDFQHQWSAHGSPKILNHAIRLWTAAVQLPPRAMVHAMGKYEQAIEQLGGYEVVRAFKTDSFFLALRKRAPAKWRKAVSEFIKAVG